LDPSGQRNYELTFRFQPKAPEEKPVLAAPYSAVEVMDRELPNGVRSQEAHAVRKLARDSKGRTRVERRLFLGGQLPDGPLVVEIFDAVAGAVYVLDTTAKMAYRKVVANPPGQIEVPRTGPVVASAPATAGLKPPGLVDLGTKTIEGQAAAGTRLTRAFGSGPEGDGPPIVSITEIWTSAKLKTAVLTKLTDSVNGTVTTALTNISEQEPDASLFAIPDGYRVKDVEAEFEVTFKLTI
jgi:hypothetical protein